MNININDDEALGLINRLLERLHQADMANFCSHLQIVYVASGGQYAETHINYGAYPRPLPKGNEEDTILPETLSTDKAIVLWRKAQREGYVDERYQPLISRTQAALMADAMAERLGIKEKWKVFEGFWNRKYMRSDYNLALTQKQSYEFQDKLKRLFG